MIPPKQGHDPNNDPDFHTNYKKHIRKTLHEHNYISMDRQWIKRYHSWAGHVARLEGKRWAKKALMFKNTKWWRAQQQMETGHRHTKTRGNISKWEGSLVRYHTDHDRWYEAAQNRERWQKTFPDFERAVLGKNHPHNLDKTPSKSQETTEGTPENWNSGQGRQATKSTPQGCTVAGRRGKGRDPPPRPEKVGGSI